MSALATVARKSLNGRFTAKIDFPIRHFILPLLMLTLEWKSKSLHTLFDKYLDHMLKSHGLNHTKFCVLTKNGEEFLTKCLRHFGRCFSE